VRPNGEKMSLAPVIVLCFVGLFQSNNLIPPYLFLSNRLTTPALRKKITNFHPRSSRHSVAAAVLFMSVASTIISNTGADTHCSFPDDILELDTYNGVTIRIDNTVSFTEVDFQERLSASLAAWRKDGKRGIWIHLPTASAHFVPICTEAGFDFHSAERGKAILTQWLDSSTPSRLPLGPTHQIGVGCLVLNKENKMLVVKEQTGPAAKVKLWKIPTGLLDPGEDIPAAAERELKEETGLDGTLHRILCARHASSRGGRAIDLYHVCLMKLAESEDPPKIVKQDSEIAAVQWMDISDYCAQEHWQKSPLYQELNEAMQNAIESGGFEAKRLPTGYYPGTQTIYVPPKL